jgi:hypothetical protein
MTIAPRFIPSPRVSAARSTNSRVSLSERRADPKRLTPRFLNPCRVERPRAPQPLDVSNHLLVIRQPLQRDVHGFLDRAGASDAPGSLQEIVINVDESLGHRGSI